MKGCCPPASARRPRSAWRSGSSLGAFVLAFAGYVPDAVSEVARSDIRSAYFLVAGGLLAVQAGIVWFWPMDGRWRDRFGASAA